MIGSIEETAVRPASAPKGGRAGHVTTTRFAPRLLIRQLDRLLVIRIEEVDWFEAEGNQIQVHVRSESHLFRHSLGALWDKLDPSRFARVNRSAIVNLDSVAEVEFPAGACELVLRGGHRLVVARRCRQYVLRQLGMV